MILYKGLFGPLTAYSITAMVLLVASSFSGHRFWSLGTVRYLPSPAIWIFLSIFVAAPVILIWRTRKIESKNIGKSSSGLSSSNILGGLSVLLVALFVMFPSNTHFNGDGYHHLGQLENPNPLVKLRDFGEQLIHVSAYRWLEGKTSNPAEVAYRSISIVAGIAFCVTLLLCTVKLIEDRLRRLLFFLAMASGGYILLFFGYVENYSILCLTIAITSLTGLLSAQDKLSPVWVVTSAIFACFLHGIGLFLLPSTIYILVRRTKLGTWFRDMVPSHRYIIAATTILAGSSAFLWLYNTNFFFRIAFLPLLPLPTTVEGYTLLSANHIIDYFGLLVCLCPGIMV